MALEQFKSQGRGAGSEQHLISLRKSGSIGINGTAMEEWFEDATHVNLYIDEENNKIGIEPLGGHGEHSYKLNKTESSGSVTSSAFMNTYQLTPDITTRFEAEWDDDEEMVVVDLDSPRGTYGSPADAEEDEE